jgi:beta-aspartyl-peptidase (threonine type)
MNSSVWAALLLVIFLCGCSMKSSNVVPAVVTDREWALALHAGVGTIRRDAPPERQEEIKAALAQALDAGRVILDQGGTSLDAVEAVVLVLEDCPHFNAGRGAAVARDGGHELDASIMRGDTMEAGAVTGVRTVRHPISLARAVMEKTPHVFMSGAGAEALAEEAGLERVENEWFRTEERYARWQREQGRNRVSREAGEMESGTVGAVARDRHGNLAAATSTGGTGNKLNGRIGDSPIIGAGTYASNASCALSATGWGEEFIRQTVAFRVAARMEMLGETLEEAVREVFTERLEPGTGGAIAVDAKGNVVLGFNTRAMYRGATDSTGRFEVGIWEMEQR